MLNKETLKQATIVASKDHIIDQDMIDKNAQKILHRLNKHDYQAFLVGGGVRDLLLDRKPKDFDIATDARPNQVKKLFRNCRLIGRRFRLAHLYFHKQLIEVSTFRAMPTEQSDDSHSHHGMILQDNIYGTIEEDAWRRDISINAIYYNITDGSLLDFTGGLQDIDLNLIRIIGDPELRYREDPVRMLRVIRFAAKLDMTIEPMTGRMITKMGGMLANVPQARLSDELLKIIHSGACKKAFLLLHQYGLLKFLLPQSDDWLGDQNPRHQALVNAGLAYADQLALAGEKFSMALLQAMLLWQSLSDCQLQLQAKGHKLHAALNRACHQVLQQQQSSLITLSKITRYQIYDIWLLQMRLQQRQTRYIRHTLYHKAFDQALVLLRLRAEDQPDLQAVAEWWQQLSNFSPNEVDRMLRHHHLD